MTPTDRNPGHSTILQALLDLADTGHGGQTVDELIKQLQADKHLTAQLQAKWAGHAYKSLPFTQLTIDDHYLILPDPAIRILLLLGMRCAQTGLIQISRADICGLTRLKTTTVKAGLKTLIESGCIRVYKDPVRHAAPIYQVSPRLFTKGAAKALPFDYSDCSGQDSGFLLVRPMDLRAAVERVYLETPSVDDGDVVERIPYTRVTAVATKKEPADAATSASSTGSSRPQKTFSSKTIPQKPVSHKPKTGIEAFPDDLPGQMTIDDYLRDLPDSVDDPRLPF